MLILGYLLTAVSYSMFCVSRFLKKKSQMLACDLLSKVIFIISFYCLGSLSGAYSFACTFFWLIFAYIKTKKGYRWPALYAMFEILLIIILITQFAGISSILVFTSSTLSLMSTWWFKPQQMRTTGLVLTTINLFYQLSLHNPVGLMELVVAASNYISYRRYRTQPVDDMQQQAS